MNILFCGSLSFNSITASVNIIKIYKEILEKNGHKVYLMGSGNCETIKYDEDKSQFIYRNCDVKSYLPYAFQIIRHDAKSLGKYLPRIIEENSIQLVIVYSGFFPILEKISSISKNNRIKIITMGGEYFSLGFTNFLNSININQFLAKKFSFRKYDGHICATFFHQKEIKNKGIKTIVLPTLYPDERLKNYSLKDLNKDKNFNLVFMGPVVKREYIHRIIKSVNILKDRGYIISLYLISSIPKLKNRKSLANKLGKAIMTDVKVISEFNRIKKVINSNPDIHITGFLSEHDKIKLLSKANAFIHLRKPSKETAWAFPTRLPEYAVHKKPIILSNCEPFSHYFNNRKDAILINPKNSINSIISAIKDLYHDKELCNELGENAGKLAREHFSVTSVGNRLIKFLESF